VILSHLHNFIFIKTRKTGGTSVEIALSAVTGPADILAPMRDDDEAKRVKAAGAPARNFAITHHAKSKPTKKAKKSAMPSVNLVGALGSHAEINHLIKYGFAAMLSRYFVFTVERHPFDRIISLYYYRRSQGLKGSLKDFIRTQTLIPNSQHYVHKGYVAADYIIDYATLEEEFAVVCEALGLKNCPPLPRAKSGLRKDDRPWQDLLDAEDIARLEEIFAVDLTIYANLPKDLTKARRAAALPKRLVLPKDRKVGRKAAKPVAHSAAGRPANSKATRT